MTAPEGPAVLEVHAAWTLTATFGLSAVYEIWRATVKSGVSRHDGFGPLLQTSVLYVVAAVVIGLLFAGVGPAAWIGLVFCLAGVALSIGYYNPRMMFERQPGLIDWAEDLLYTGLLLVAAVQLGYHVAGRSLA